MIARAAHHAPSVDTELAVYVARVEALVADGEHAAAMAEIQQALPEAWHGFRPERLAALLETILASGVQDNGFAAGFLTFVRGDDTQRYRRHEGDVVTEQLPDVMKLALAVDLRMRGKAMEALALFDSIDGVTPLQPVFNARGGWDLMIIVQHGVTAMLAGQFERALSILTAARFASPYGPLLALTRDAHAKIALLHAAIGDQREAQIALDHAALIPRTASWIEPRVDATAALAASMLSSTPPERALADLQTMPLADIGEMWPYYAFALQRAYQRTGRVHELGARLALLEDVPFPYERGVGFVGSVLPVIRAARALLLGDLRSAAEFAASADQSVVVTQLARAAIEVASGHPQRALRTAGEIIRRTQPGGLRQLEVWRSSVAIDAYLALDRPAEALLALRTAAALPDGMRPDELVVFSPQARAFAAEHLNAVFPSPPEVVPVLRGHLTARERDVVRMLATGTTRAEIAAALYISINTLKKHLHAVYEKLGVANRDAAVIRARAEGWL